MRAEGNVSSSPHALLHGPLFSRTRPLDRENAASRISAYIYGNVLVLAALVPITTSAKHVGILVVLGTALSTFVAHVFAEAVGYSVRHRSRSTRAEMVHELRNSVPILSSAVLPCVVLATGWLGWLEPRTAQIAAELAVLVRIGGIVFVIGHLNGERPNRASVLTAAFLTVVAATVVIVKILLTH
ncbi:hypothetical protein SAMN04244553_0974 [Nocardia amikacinitolerans]|uniref:Integral membrane protein n=1 Tax=Nocardia amikacinitolerans TaxID=756689 RepID=A0A285KZS7_9NOCA|nr:hypothetical protein [Nocardia amikacinitolerans]SNY77317.1 hypothetical protein SAMN04244553_0974 [Nocardia amikacinitolerans]